MPVILAFLVFFAILGTLAFVTLMRRKDFSKFVQSIGETEIKETGTVEEARRKAKEAMKAVRTREQEIEEEKVRLEIERREIEDFKEEID